MDPPSLTDVVLADKDDCGLESVRTVLNGRQVSRILRRKRNESREDQPSEQARSLVLIDEGNSLARYCSLWTAGVHFHYRLAQVEADIGMP